MVNCISADRRRPGSTADHMTTTAAWGHSDRQTNHSPRLYAPLAEAELLSRSFFVKEHTGWKTARDGPYFG